MALRSKYRGSLGHRVRPVDGQSPKRVRSSEFSTGLRAATAIVLLFALGGCAASETSGQPVNTAAADAGPEVGSERGDSEADTAGLDGGDDPSASDLDGLQACEILDATVTDSIVPGGLQALQAPEVFGEFDPDMGGEGEWLTACIRGGAGGEYVLLSIRTRPTDTWPNAYLRNRYEPLRGRSGIEDLSSLLGTNAFHQVIIYPGEGDVSGVEFVEANNYVAVEVGGVPDEMSAAINLAVAVQSAIRVAPG